MRTLATAVFLLAALTPLCDADAQVLRRRNRDTDERQTLQHNGLARTYIVRVPARVAQSDSPVPLVIVLHGGGGNAVNAETMTGFTTKAESEAFIVVYPEGTARGRVPLLTWNAGHCCGYAMEKRVDDVGFIGALVDRLRAAYRIDANRIYVTGMSNGAMMAHRLGIELSHRIAAIAPVVGAVFGDEKSPRAPVSAIMINGVVDESVPYEGGPPGGRASKEWDGTPTKPAKDQAVFWAAANRCSASPQISDHGRYLLAQYDCPHPLGVAIYSVRDNGHAWPGGEKGSRRADAPSTAIDATDVIWEFFAAHRVHQHHSHNLSGIPRGVESHQKAANRLSDEHVRVTHSCGVQEQMQLQHFLCHGARRGTRLAPAQTSAVIRAHPHIWRQNTLHSRPVAREAATTSFQNDSRASVRWPHATDVHLVTANINELSRGGARRWRLSHRLLDRGNQ